MLSPLLRANFASIYFNPTIKSMARRPYCSTWMNPAYEGPFCFLNSTRFDSRDCTDHSLQRTNAQTCSCNEWIVYFFNRQIARDYFMALNTKEAIETLLEVFLSNFLMFRGIEMLLMLQSYCCIFRAEFIANGKKVQSKLLMLIKPLGILRTLYVIVLKEREASIIQR